MTIDLDPFQYVVYLPNHYSITPDFKERNEGQQVKFLIQTTKVKDGTVLYWTLQGVTTDTESGAVYDSDFSSPNNAGSAGGQVTINNNQADFTLTISEDKYTEGDERFRAHLRRESTSGRIVATSDDVIIKDTSLSPPVIPGEGGGGSGGSGSGPGGVGITIPGVPYLSACAGHQVVWNKQGTKVAFLHNMATEVNYPYAVTIYNVIGNVVSVAKLIEGLAISNTETLPLEQESVGNGSGYGFYPITGTTRNPSASWNADGTLFALNGYVGVTGRKQVVLYGGYWTAGAGGDFEPGFPAMFAMNQANAAAGLGNQYQSVSVIYETTNWTPVLRCTPTGQTVHQGTLEADYGGYEDASGPHTYDFTFGDGSRVYSPPGEDYHQLVLTPDGYRQTWICPINNIAFDDTESHIFAAGKCKFSFLDLKVKVMPYPRNVVFRYRSLNYIDPPIAYYMLYDVYYNTGDSHYYYPIAWHDNKFFSRLQVTSAESIDDGIDPTPFVLTPGYTGFPNYGIRNRLYEYDLTGLNYNTSSSAESPSTIDYLYRVRDQYVAMAIDEEPYIVVYSSWGQNKLPLAATITPPAIPDPPDPNNPTNKVRKWKSKFIEIGKDGNIIAISRRRMIDPYTTTNTNLNAVVFYNRSGQSLSNAGLPFETLATFLPGPMAINPAGDKIAIFNEKDGQNHMRIYTL